MGGALLLSSILANTLFIVGEPTINYTFITQLKDSPALFFQHTSGYIASLAQGRKGVETYQEQVKTEQYVAQGYAKTDEHMYIKSSTTKAPEDTNNSGNNSIPSDHASSSTSQRDVTVALTGDQQYTLQTVAAPDGRQVELWLPE